MALYDVFLVYCYGADGGTLRSEVRTVSVDAGLDTIIENLAGKTWIKLTDADDVEFAVLVSSIRSITQHIEEPE
jgi:hypothetical protein